MLYSVIGTEKDVIASGNEYLINNYNWFVRALGLVCITSITLVHAYSPKWGIRIQDGFTVVKIIILLFVIFTGVAAATGLSSSLPRADSNFTDFFKGTSSDATSYTSALFGAFFMYDGWNNLNYSMDELIDPIKNLPIAALSSVGITSFLYISATIAYFVVVPTAAIDTTNTVLAGQFFTMTLGPTVGNKVIPFLIGLSAFGSVMCMTFGASRVTFSAAREGYFPFSKFLGTANKYDSPQGALILHFAMTVLLMLGPPPGTVYKFLIDLAGYPEWVFYGISVVGLLYLRFTQPDHSRPFKSFWTTNILFIIVCVFLAIFPFVPPTNRPLVTDGLPYYLYAVISVIWMLLCIPWWYLQIIVYKGKEKSINGKFSRENLDLDNLDPKPLSQVNHSFNETFVDSA